MRLAFKTVIATSITAALLLCSAAGASASPYMMDACGDDEQGATPAWTVEGSGNWNLEGTCASSMYLDQVATAVGGMPRWAELYLGPGRIDSAEVFLRGSNGSERSVALGVSICGPGGWPTNCGTPVALPAGAPVTGQEIPISGSGKIPPGADRIVMHASCLLPSCPVGPPLHIDWLIVHLSDESPPSIHLRSPSGWTNSTSPIDVDASDPESGIWTIRAAPGLNGYASVPTCSAAGALPDEFSNAWICPRDVSVAPNLAEVMGGGHTRFTVSAWNAAGMKSSAFADIAYDPNPPRDPAGVNFGASSHGWLMGKHVVLRWKNLLEETGAGYASDIVKADVDLEAVGEEADPPMFTVEGPGVDTAVFDLEGYGERNGRVRTVDGAGNISGWTPFTIRNDVELIGSPSNLVAPPINKESETTGATFSWSATAPLSGICGYRAKLDPDPNLDLGPSDPERPLTTTTASWFVSPETVKSLPDGATSLHVKSVACSDAVSETTPKSVIVDRTPPTVSVDPQPSSGWLTNGGSVDVKPVDVGAGPPPTLDYRLDGGATVSTGPAGKAVSIPSGTHHLWARATDGVGNTSDELALTIGTDGSPPTAVIERPSPSDPSLLQASVSDAESGVTQAWIELGRAGAPMRRFGQKFLANTGTQGPVRLQARIPDDGSLADGDYAVQIVALDAAGRSSTTAVFDDGSSASMHLPLRPPAQLTAGVAPRGKGQPLRARVFDFGARARLVGSLRGRGGSPLSGAKLSVFERTEDDLVHSLDTVTTGADGSFTLPLGPGVSREIHVRYKGDTLTGPAEALVKQNFRSGVSMRVHRARGGVVFIGRVDPMTASIPEGGVPVTLELCPKLRCTPFGRSAVSDSDGGFSASWPAGKVGHRKLLRVRARVSGATAGWPFADGVSKIITVKLSGR